MQEIFENIIKKLEQQKEKSSYITDGIANRRIYDNGIKNAIEIVNQVAEEYNGGWIPCSVDLPKAHIEVWITYKWDDGSIHVGRDRVIHGEWYCTKREAVMAWKYMKVPAPYQPKGETK